MGNVADMNYESSGMYALTDETRTSRRRWLVLGGIAAIIVILAAAFFMMRPAAKPAAGTGGTTASGAPEDQLPTVSVGSPGRNSVDRMVSATGSLAARVDMPVGVAGEGGRVTAVLVQPGQWVGAGQVLATVDRSVQVQTASSLAASIAVAKSDAAIAQSEYNRAQALVGRGFISKADLERLGATRDSANARVKVAQAQLSETQARNAPAAGLILTRSVEPGQIISSGSGTLFRMAKGGEMELRAEVAESDIKGITIGSRADVTPVGGGQAYSGQVWQLPPVIDPQTRRGVVRVAIPYNAALRPGGFASTAIYGGANTSPILPNSAIQTDASGNFVYIVGKDDKVARRAIKTGEVTDRGVAIVDGLAGDERVVLSAGAFLAPGQKIKPILRKL
jgi:RND family efflux transporter MFP subunit